MQRVELNEYGFRCRTPLVTLSLWTKNSSDGWNSKIPVGVTVTKKQAKIPDRVYPRDLHGILQGLWDNKPLFRGWPNVELPPKAVFDEIIDVCYHASMLTEEGRPTVFRIVDPRQFILSATFDL